MRHEKHVLLLRSAVGRVNEVLQKEFPELSPADHSFVCDHASMLLHQSFHYQAITDQKMAEAKKPSIIVPTGPIDG